MNTRLGLVFSVLAVVCFGALPQANAQVMVIGGGMARDCYKAVEFGSAPMMQAMRMCDLAIDQEHLDRKDRAATFVNRGVLLMRQGMFERAMWDYQEGLRLEPTLLAAKVNIGAALYGMQRYDEAMQALNEGIKTDSPEARAIGLYNRGLVWEHKGNVAAAYYDYKAALDLQPTFVQAAKQLERFTVKSASDAGS